MLRHVRATVATTASPAARGPRLRRRPRHRPGQRSDRHEPRLRPGLEATANPVTLVDPVNVCLLDDCRHACHKRSCGNIADDDRTGGYDGPVPNGHALQDCRVHADPHVVADSYGLRTLIANYGVIVTVANADVLSYLHTPTDLDEMKAGEIESRVDVTTAQGQRGPS